MLLQNLRLGPTRAFVLLGVAYCLGFVPVLAVVPAWFPVNPSIVSAAAAEGYNNNVAYVGMVLWALTGLAIFAIFQRSTNYRNKQPVGLDIDLAPEVASPRANRFRSLEIAVVFLGAVAMYFPIFLAKYGPFIEDEVFLNVLLRMQSGQQPYVDFEFLYGPLMIYPAHLWTKLFGYSMVSFYSYLALLEALPFVALLAVLQRYFSKPLIRYAVFLLIAVLLFNTLLGPNQNAIRKLLPVFLILLITVRPRSLMTIAAGSLLLGLQLSYSHEYGVAALVGILGMYGFLAVRERDVSYVRFALATLIISASVWYASSALLLGEGFSSYIVETVYLSRQFGAGEAGFRFYWTLNSLAIFGLIGLACVFIGRGITRPTDTPIGPGDLLLLCGLVYALIGLKSGLNRADLWHLNPPILVLVVAFLLPSAKSLFAYSNRIRWVATTLIVIIAATYLVGILPSGSLYASGLLRGLRDSIAPQATTGVIAVKTRAPTVEIERSHPDLEAIRMGEYLADESRADRPVFFYYDLWELGIYVGVPKTDFINDDFLYSDERGDLLRNYLEEREEVIVVISRPVYERLFGLSNPKEDSELELRYQTSVTKSLAKRLSTVHYQGVETELQLKEQRWERTVGDYVRSHFGLVAEFGDYLVLMRE